MKYEVTGDSCALGPGQRVKLNEKQIDTRAHVLTVLDEKTGEVEPTTQVVFKKGEIIDLPEKPDDLSSYFRSVLTPASKKKPQSEGAKAADQPKATDPNAGGNQNGAGNNAPNPAA